MPIENIRCNSCGAMCEDSTVRRFLIPMENHGELKLFGPGPIAITICEFCLMDENEPIPFTVTEKGIAESMRQVAKENGNA